MDRLRDFVCGGEHVSLAQTLEIGYSSPSLVNTYLTRSLSLLCTPRLHTAAMPPRYPAAPLLHRSPLARSRVVAVKPVHSPAAPLALTSLSFSYSRHFYRSSVVPPDLHVEVILMCIA
jgi:hypothetical protein